MRQRDEVGKAVNPNVIRVHTNQKHPIVNPHAHPAIVLPKHVPIFKDKHGRERVHRRILERFGLVFCRVLKLWRHKDSKEPIYPAYYVEGEPKE